VGSVRTSQLWSRTSNLSGPARTADLRVGWQTGLRRIAEMLAPAFGEFTRQPKGDSMKRKSKRKYRLVIDFNEQSVTRFVIKQRAPDGSYQALDSPWGTSELAGLKLAAKATTMASRGVANLDEVCRTATRRRKSPKKPPVEGILKTNRTGDGHNGKDHEAEFFA
jgi:hypothetical protein